MFILFYSSTLCFVVYGMRNSELYAERVFNNEKVGRLDTFLASISPNAVVSACWLITCLTQLLHAKRMDTEAKFHRRSVDDQNHSKIVHRITSWIDHKMKKKIEIFQVGVGVARIATPIRVILLVLSASPGAVSLFTACTKNLLTPEQYYILASGNNSLCFSLTTAFMYVFSNLEDNFVVDKLCLLWVLMIFGTDAYIKGGGLGKWVPNFVFGTVFAIANCAALKMKATTVRGKKERIISEQCELSRHACLTPSTLVLK